MEKTISKAAQKRADIERSITTLQAMLPPGSTVYTTLRSVARSGMSRKISLACVADGEIKDITGWVARVCEYRRNDDGSITVGGCGMDAGFHVVYHLASVLYPTFTCCGKGCPSNDHSNGDRNYEPHVHSSGWYAFHHRWM